MIHVVYTIYKKDSAIVHDIVTSTETYWQGTSQVNGGIRADLLKKYPEDEFIIKVDVITSAGNVNE